jgi:hypothetical protein
MKKKNIAIKFTPSSEERRIMEDNKRWQEMCKMPSLKKCQSYKKPHTETYKNYHFYFFNMYLPEPIQGEKTREWVFSSSSMSRSNISEMVTDALKEGRFIELKEITMKEYADNGGGDIPCCLKNCKRINRRGYPLCVSVE